MEATHTKMKCIVLRTWSARHGIYMYHDPHWHLAVSRCQRYIQKHADVFCNTGGGDHSGIDVRYTVKLTNLYIQLNVFAKLIIFMTVTLSFSGIGRIIRLKYVCCVNVKFSYISVVDVC